MRTDPDGWDETEPLTTETEALVEDLEMLQRTYVEEGDMTPEDFMIVLQATHDVIAAENNMQPQGPTAIALLEKKLHDSRNGGASS